MNVLIVGTNKSDILEHLPPTFLIVDDGTLIDRIPCDPEEDTVLDLSRHSFNPLQDMDYYHAQQFISVLNAAFPKGAETLTKQNAGFVLLEALLSGAKRLDKLIRIDKSEKDTGIIDAYRTIQALLLSPVLKRFLCNPAHHTNFSLEGKVFVRLDPREHARSDRFIIANLLISNYAGPVIIPDFGFYGCEFHADFIDQNRLIAGVNYLDESPLKNQLLLMKTKIGRACTVEDAKTLASYAGLVPDFTREENEYNRFIKERIDTK